MRFTRRHLQTAIVLGAVAGLAATSPGVRDAGVVVLGLAASLAVLEQSRVSTEPTNPPLAGAA